RRIAHPPRQLAARSAGRSRREHMPLAVDRDRSYGSLLMAAVMLRGMLIHFAFRPGVPLGFADQLFWIAQRQSLLYCESFGASRDEHHVIRMLKDFARHANRILYAPQSRRRARAERFRVHHDGVALDMSVKIQVRPV